jgi:hypothetical protein
VNGNGSRNQRRAQDSHKLMLNDHALDLTIP